MTTKNNSENNPFLSCHDTFVMPRIVKQKLENVFNCPMTIINAGIGFGKSTAVKEFIHRSKTPFVPVEISLFNSKDSLEYFWQRFSKAIAQHDKSIGTILSKMGFPTTTEEIMATLDFCRENMNKNYRTIIFIDDYQYCNETLIDKLFETALHFPIDILRIVIITRQMPKFGIEDFCAKGLCQVINQQDLTFSKEEAHEYFNLQNFVVSEEEFDKIYAASGGWITAIYLIIIGMQQGMKFEEITSVEDLIETAIYNNCTTETKHLLLRLAILDDYTADEAACILKKYSTKNQIISIGNEIPLIGYDCRTKKYKLHTMFLNFLRKTIEKTDFQCKDVMKAAGEYYLSVNNFNAYNYFFLIKDYDSVLSAIEIPDEFLFTMAEKKIIDEIWREQPDFIYKYPIAALRYCLNLYIFGDISLSHKIADLLCSYFSKATDCPYPKNPILGELAITKAFFSLNNPIKACVEVKKAADYLGDNVSKLILSHGVFSYGCPSLMFIYLADTAYLKTIAFEIDDVYATLQKVTNGCNVCCDNLFRGEYYLLTGDLSQSEHFTNKSIFQATSAKDYSMTICGIFNSARISIMQGDCEKAIESITKWSCENANEMTPILRNSLDMARDYLCGILGIADRNPAWLIENKQQTNIMNQCVGFATIITIKSLILESNYTHAEVLCEALLKENHSTPNSMCSVYSYLYLSIIKNALGSSKESQFFLAAATTACKNQNIILPFLENSAHLLPIVKSYLEVSTAVESPNFTFLQDVKDAMISFLALLPKSFRITLMNTIANSPYEKSKKSNSLLSEREKEVIIFLAQGLTRDEISKKLFLSHSTIKTYLNNIYKKYGVNNKIQAITAAEEDGII